VISGTFNIGMGDKLDPSKTQAISAGGVAIMQPKMNHFAWTKEETILQVQLGRGRSITSTLLTTRARRRSDKLQSYGSVTLRVRLVTELRYGTGFYKNPYPS